MASTINPFTGDADRAEIWDMLVERDLRAFANADWAMVENDFVVEGFFGIDAQRKNNPDDWRINFPSLEEYRNEWLRQAHDFKNTAWKTDPVGGLMALTTLHDIEIKGTHGLVHKKFDGLMVHTSGQEDHLKWQTLYQVRKVSGSWKISGFIGYLPYPMGTEERAVAKRKPAGAAQHKTAGPYSPVLEVNASKLIVISGQASIDPGGIVIGDTIEEQTHYTLKNCLAQLQSAGCDFSDVFKVNVYLTDLDEWPAFNEVYKTYFPEPMPVRAAVGTDLLMTLKVEIEMWAAK